MKKCHPSKDFYVLIFYLLLTIASSASVFPAFATPTMEDAFSPAQGATALVIKTIGTARQSIHVAAYSFTSRPIADALVAAHDKGVDVEVVLDKSQRRGKMAAYIAAHGIPTRISYRYSIMHDKFILVDGQTVELGSFNYTSAAEKKNAENVLVIHGSKKIVTDYDKQWRILWDGAEEK
jgi:phosphatidylserine/phosphatidylglycerophosphate/cardiolipin synthase-like enzyme